MIIIEYETLDSLTIDSLCIKIKKMKGAAMNDEEIRRAIMDPCLSDEQVYKILMEEYELPALSSPFTHEEIEILCKENTEINLLTNEMRPQIMKRIEQELLEEHQGCCIPAQ